MNISYGWQRKQQWQKRLIKAGPLPAFLKWGSTVLSTGTTELVCFFPGRKKMCFPVYFCQFLSTSNIFYAIKPKTNRVSDSIQVVQKSFCEQYFLLDSFLKFTTEQCICQFMGKAAHINIQKVSVFQFLVLPPFFPRKWKCHSLSHMKVQE